MTSYAPTLHIDLKAITENWLFLKAKTKAPVITAAVVKANGYGLGAIKIAPALYQKGCRVFFTAYLEEAMQILPALGDDCKIYVLNGFHKNEQVDPRIAPVINSVAALKDWADTARPLILHIDTGMNRLGISLSELEDIRLHNIKNISLMSHLASADEPHHPMNERQLIIARTLKKLFPNHALSLANSAGILLSPDYHFDMVRPGIGLYGGQPQNIFHKEIKPVIKLTAKLLAIRTIDRGETVGYGASYRAENAMTIGTIALGYADGYTRRLSSSSVVKLPSVVKLHGEFCPVIGRISMDLITIDITKVKKASIMDDVIIFDEEITAPMIAEKAGTIDYEILTSLGQRFQRVYHGEIKE